MKGFKIMTSINLLDLQASAAELQAEKTAALNLADANIKRAKTDFLNDTSAVNKALLAQALADKISIIKYYDAIII